MEVPWRPAKPRPAPSVRELRASDADRERVAALLSDALADGRLNIDEHAERTSQVYEAVTLGDLTGLTLDLLPPEAQPIQLDERPLQATFGSVRRHGRWVVPMRVPVTAVFGTVELDLREAVLQRRHVVIDATVLCGRVHLLVPEGVRVQVTGRSVLTSRELRTRADDGQRPPVIEVSGMMLLGSVKARTPRRGWRERLRPLGRLARRERRS